jgi:hypothetical protein
MVLEGSETLTPQFANFGAEEMFAGDFTAIVLLPIEASY